jgi:glycosyltransferase involved in cell wall biosynthesis
MSDPRVSVLMPVRDAAPFLERAVRSILDQSLSDLELIAVDDGSTDASGAILSRLAAGDRRLRVVHQKRARGPAALNHAWSLAQAPFLARMDADDIAHPFRLDRQVAELEARPSLGVIGSRVRFIDERGDVLGRWDVPLGPALVRWSLLFANPVCHPSVVVRRSAVEDVSPYDNELAFAEDYDLWVRLAERLEIDNLAETLVDKRVHTRSVSARNEWEQRRQAASISRRARARLAGVELPERDELAVDATADPSAADDDTLARLPSVVRRLRHGYSAAWQLSSGDSRSIRVDCSRRVWRVARRLASDRRRPAARLVLAATLLLADPT